MKKKIVVTDDLIRKEKLNYYKEWRSKNKDKVK